MQTLKDEEKLIALNILCESLQSLQIRCKITAKQCEIANVCYSQSISPLNLECFIQLKTNKFFNVISERSIIFWTYLFTLYTELTQVSETILFHVSLEVALLNTFSPSATQTLPEPSEKTQLFICNSWNLCTFWGKSPCQIC